jgi:hypothetical protein
LRQTQAGRFFHGLYLPVLLVGKPDAVRMCAPPVSLRLRRLLLPDAARWKSCLAFAMQASLGAASLTAGCCLRLFALQP